MDTKATGLPPDASQISSEVTAGITSADSIAVQGIQNLQWVHQARLSQLSRALAEAKAQYPSDSPEVKTAEAAVAANTATVGRVSMVRQRLTTPDPEVAKDGWALHGHVYVEVDLQLNPVSGFTVFLVDGQETYQRAFGFSSTNETGYFLLNYLGPQVAAKATAVRVSQSTSVSQVFLRIANTKAQFVFLSKAAFQPVTGSATYKDIILPPGNLGDLPKEIRDIALPKKTKKSVSPAERNG
ncbi:MAG: hypothetical protein CV088_02730 [Nitrospira sp. LK70]|nr:hypothetical protein [Nitrospira sp. LK70]